MAYIECDLDHKVPSIYDTLDIESKNTLDMTYIKGYSFPVQPKETNGIFVPYYTRPKYHITYGGYVIVS